MTTSMATSLRCSPAITTTSAQCGRIRSPTLGRTQVGVTRAGGLGVGLRGGFENRRGGLENGRGRQWAGGELRGQILLQRRSVAVRGNSGWRGLTIVAEENKGDVFRAAGFLVKAGKNALDAGTDLVPETIPRNVARIIVGVLGVSVITYAVRALFSTALFILAIAGFSYLAYIYLNKDSDSGSGGGGGSGSSRSPEDSLEEARRIMDKYK